MTPAAIALPKKESPLLFAGLTWREFKAVEQLLYQFHKVMLQITAVKPMLRQEASVALLNEIGIRPSWISTLFFGRSFGDN